MGCASEGRKRLERGLNFPKFMFMKENIGRVNTVEREFTMENGEEFILLSPPFTHAWGNNMTKPFSLSQKMIYLYVDMKIENPFIFL